jgi:hypothetical protein
MSEHSPQLATLYCLKTMSFNCYRYTGKERDDSSGLCYYGALHLLVRFSYSADSIALVIINVVLCGVAVCFSELVEGVIQVQQKRYRYTSKERDDSSGLCYYGARYLAPWLAFLLYFPHFLT